VSHSQDQGFGKGKKKKEKKNKKKIKKIKKDKRKFRSAKKSRYCEKQKADIRRDNQVSGNFFASTPAASWLAGIIRENFDPV